METRNESKEFLRSLLIWKGIRKVCLLRWRRSKQTVLYGKVMQNKGNTKKENDRKNDDDNDSPTQNVKNV